jgi:hypothetical protein
MLRFWGMLLDISTQAAARIATLKLSLQETANASSYMPSEISSAEKNFAMITNSHLNSIQQNAFRATADRLIVVDS